MKTLLLEITEELAEAVDSARGDTARNPAIEDWLWQIRDIRRAAKERRLKRKPRPRRGRPPMSPFEKLARDEES